MKEILITSSALILALLLMRRVFQKVLSRRVQYALWALVLVRLLVPVSLPAVNFSVLTAARPIQTVVDQRLGQAVRPAQPSGQTIYNAPDPSGVLAAQGGQTALNHTPYEGPLPPLGQPISPAADVPSPATAQPDAGMTAGEALTLVWKIGMAAMAGFFLLSNLTFYLRLRKNRRTFETVSTRPVYLVPEGVIPSPCLFGRSIYITPAVARDPHKLRHVLCHEETHARHLDPLWSLLRCVCLTVYWFDPLVWAAAHCSKTDCELACDESALKALGEQERIPYGQTLLSLIPVRRTANPMLAATTMTAGKKELKDRVTRIAKRPRQLLAAALAVALLAGLVSACTFTGAKESPTPQPEGLRSLTGEELRWFNEEYFNRNPDPAISYTYSIRNQFANGPFNTYEKPEDIDLFQLFYCDGDVYNDPENDVCPSYQITETQINAILTQYTGLTLEETNKVGLENFVYQNGAYCWSHGDTNYPGNIEFLYGTREGDRIQLYHHGWNSGSQWYCATMEEQEDGSYHFRSNLECEKPAIPPVRAGEPVAAVSLRDLEPYVAPTVTPEMHTGDLRTRIEYRRLSNDQLLCVYIASDNRTYAAIELENEGFNVFLDLTNCDFSVDSFQLFGYQGFSISYSGGPEGSYHGTWVDYYIVSDDGVPALLLRSDDEWGQERILDLDGDGTDELATRSAIFFAKEGLIYRADLEKLLLGACTELSSCDQLFWDPYGRYCTAVSFADADSRFRTCWRYLWFDGERLLIYRDVKAVTDHMAEGVADNVPQAVVKAARDYVQQVFEAGEEGQKLQDGDFVPAPVEFDDWRITSITKGSRNTVGNLTVEGWHFNYELHTTTPDTVTLAGGRYLTEDDWVSPGYPDCDWLFFRTEDDSHTLLWQDVINDMGPASYVFEPYLEGKLDELGLLDDDPLFQIKNAYEAITADDQFTMTLIVGDGLAGSYPAGGWNRVSSITDQWSGYTWEHTDQTERPDFASGPIDYLAFSREDESLVFWDLEGLVQWQKGENSRWYKAVQTDTDDPFSTDIYHYLRRWYDETELEALRQGIAIPGEGRTRDEIAQAWVEEYEGVYLSTSSGSTMKWDYMKVIDCAEYKGDEPFVSRLEENTFPFSWSTIFVPADSAPPWSFMAGNTSEYEGSDPDVPAGAFQWWQVGYMTQGEDGLWRCDGGGTGW